MRRTSAACTILTVPDAPQYRPTPAIAGPVLTKTLLISSVPTGGPSGGPGLVAWDKQTGEIRGAVDLPAGTVGTPMTYMQDGRQYIAVSIGGGPRIVAYALPE